MNVESHNAIILNWAYVNQLGDYIADNETKEQDKQSK